jgi:hypothetical protein
LAINASENQRLGKIAPALTVQVGLDAELRFRIELKERLGDQKIDVVLRGPGERLGFIDDIARRYGLVLEK